MFKFKFKFKHAALCAMTWEQFGGDVVLESVNMSSRGKEKFIKKNKDSYLNYEGDKNA